MHYIEPIRYSNLQHTTSQSVSSSTTLTFTPPLVFRIATLPPSTILALSFQDMPTTPPPSSKSRTCTIIIPHSPLASIAFSRLFVEAKGTASIPREFAGLGDKTADVDIRLL